MRKKTYKFILTLAIFSLLLPLGNSQAKKKSTAYVSEGTAFYAYSTSEIGTSSVYRFRNSKTGDHSYSLSDAVPKKCNAEGIAFHAYSSPANGASPVYQFFNKKTGDHFYMFSDAAPKGYALEGVAFYAYSSQVGNTLPVYRFFGGKKGDHFYTISESERDSLGGSAVSASTTTSSLGPEIAVGLWYNSKDDIFKIDANKAYNIKDKNGGVIAQVAGGSTTRVKYDDDGKLKVSSSIADTLVDDNVTFDAADGNNSDIIFDTDHSIKSEWGDYAHFRGKIEVNYYHGNDVYNGNSSSTTQIWVINKLPLEQYVWGAGETTGTAGADHARVMTTIFRTYGKWYIDNATKYKPMGFKIRSDAGSQIYLGYDREEKFPKVRQAAEQTRGRIVKYKGETALTPYCSYTDGKTRKYPDSDYPYLKSVKDHKKGTKKGLKPGEGGNHMWGLSANGAIGYAKDGKSWEWILKHYYSGVDIDPAY